MEEVKVEEALKLSELKRENLCKALEKIKSQTSDILVFTLQWSDLEFHLKSTEAKVERRFKELELKEVEFQNRSLAIEAAEAEFSDLEIKVDGFKREIKDKEGDLSVLRMLLEEHTVKVRSKRAELDEIVESFRTTQVELDLKEETLVQVKFDLKRHHSELSAVMENLDRSQSRNRELEEEIDRKEKKFATVLDKIAESEKQLELVEKKLESQQKLFETQSLDLDLKEGIIKSLDTEMEETCRHMDSKGKELEDMENLIEEKSAKYESIKLLIEEHTKELDSKEKKQNEMTKAIQKLSLEILSKKKALERAEVSIRQLSDKQHSEKDKLDSTKLHLEKCIAEVDSKNKEVLSVKGTLKNYLQNLETKERELKSLQSLITETNKRVKEGEKKMKDLDNSSEELIRQLQVKQEEISSINKAIRECSGELESKRKHHDRVQSSINDLTAQLKSKECDLSSVKKKIQDSLKDFQSKEDEQVRLKATLMEREQELELKEKQFDTRSEEIQLKEKELEKKYQQLKSTEQKLAICVKDYEQKAKTLSHLCQQSNPDQHVDLVQDSNVHEEKTLQLDLHRHLKKWHLLHVDISTSLKASSDPTKLVLDTIQGLYSTYQRMAVTDLDSNTVRRSSICLLDCLMDMSPKPKAEVQGEAIKFATECKNTTLVKAENPMEVLDFLHFLAAFSLAYNFDTDKIQNLFDVVFLRKYAPSLCTALGLSALTPVSNFLSLDDQPEQHPPEAPINNSIDSHSLDVQENIALSHLASEGVLGDYECSASFSPNEVSTQLLSFKDPGRVVLDSVEDALIKAHQRGELGIAIVKNLVTLLEDLMLIVRSIDLDLQSDAVKVAYRWSRMMGTKSQISPLEAWGFLQFIVAYGLVKQTKQDATLQFASYVAHFRQAPKLFQYLGLSSAIPYFVNKLISERKYIPAIRFIYFFNLKHDSFSPLQFLKAEIFSLTLSSKESQDEDRDAGKLRDIIELIEDLKLDISLPVDLIVKFMVPREIQNQNQCVVSVQPPQILPPYHMQASTHGGVAPNPHVEDVKTYQAGGSTAFQGQSSYQAGFKRPRVDPPDPRPVVRPCLRPPSGYGRF